MEPLSRRDGRIAIEVVVVVDDLAERRELSNLINQTKGMRCVAVAEDAGLALKLVRNANPDVIITDSTLPGTQLGEFPSMLRKALPSAKVIVWTAREDYESIFTALKGGALGYLLKSDSLSTVVEGIRSVMNGGSPMNARITRIVVGSIQQRKSKSKTTLPLTFREFQMLSSAAIGMKAREIGDQYSISEFTVRAHLRKIHIKLQVNTRAEAVLKLLESELC